MNETQEKLLSMYKDMKKVFENNNIRFYGGFGTALGAIRHKGFIPWDDDIDIIVWAEDLPKIEEAMKRELDPEKYYYHRPKADSHPHVMLKCDDFEKAMKEEKALFIDIFPIERYPRGKIRGKLANFNYDLEEFFIWFADKIKSPSLHKAFRWIPGMFKKIGDVNIEKDSDNTIILVSIFHNDVFPASYYGDPKNVAFEDTDMPLPCEIDSILTAKFGDYMTPPPEDKRVGASGYPCSVYVDYINEKKER